jgi:two-component system nitrogen regulation sensor histidine kinase GlnL
LTQAVLIFVRNAAQALEAKKDSPLITLKTRVARYVTLAKKRHRIALSLSIEDNGPGIPEAIRDRSSTAGVRPRRRQRTRSHAREAFIAQHSGAIECASVRAAPCSRFLLPSNGNAAPSS